VLFSSSFNVIYVYEVLSTNGLEVRTTSNSFPVFFFFFFKLWYLLRVIVYDRFGLHYQEIKDLLSLPGIDYYPFTGMKSVGFVYSFFHLFFFFMNSFVFSSISVSKSREIQSAICL
jgi:hypothetical protein